MARHPNAAVARPPITGPRPAPTPSTEPCTPKARPFWSAGTTSRSMAWTLGTNADANTACSALIATSSQNVPATMAAAEKTPNPVTAMVARRRAPRASQTRPASGCPTSMATRYRVTSTLARPLEMSKSRAMLGRATAIIVEFNGTRAEARAIPAMVVAGTTPSPSWVIRGSSPGPSCRPRAPAWPSRGESCRRWCLRRPGCPSPGRRWRRATRSSHDR